ncbi:MAG: LLM class flavin-dependent oxidoreductase [Gemmatimonadaceae bacterium]
MRNLDHLGYHRFSTTEHHTKRQSARPIVTTAIVASITRTMKVGMAGAMLRCQHPARVAKDHAFAGAAVSRRIDVGAVSGMLASGPELGLGLAGEAAAQTAHRDLVRCIRLPEGSIPPTRSNPADQSFRSGARSATKRRVGSGNSGARIPEILAT